jgi:hypothetical protein
MDKDECGAKLSTARVCGRSLSGMAGSNPAKGMNVSCGLADRGLCDELITRAQESYRVGPGPKGLLRRGNILKIGGMTLTMENRNTWRKLCPSATLSFTNISLKYCREIWTGWGSGQLKMR